MEFFVILHEWRACLLIRCCGVCSSLYFTGSKISYCTVAYNPSPYFFDLTHVFGNLSIDEIYWYPELHDIYLETFNKATLNIYWNLNDVYILSKGKGYAACKIRGLSFSLFLLFLLFVLGILWALIKIQSPFK